MRIAIAMLLLVGCASVPSSAQGTRYHGYWGSLGLGGGLRLVSQDGATQSTGGGAMLLRMGGKISDRFLVGGEVGGWGSQDEDIWVGRFNWTATGVLFPSHTLGMFVKGGVGGATVRAVNYTSGTADGSVNKIGFGTSVGIGYDIGFGKSASLTPGFDFMYQWVDDPDARNGALLLLTIGVTWH
jgi:hypothetical protein